MKKSALASATLAALLGATAPAFAGNIYLLTVPINAIGLKTGTRIDVSCSGGNSFVDLKGGDANSKAAALDASPPQGAAKVTVTVGTGPADAVIPLVVEAKAASAGTSAGLQTEYQCWSSFGGYVHGSLTTASSAKVTPTDSWNVGANKGS